MSLGPRYCTHAREFHSIEARAIRAEDECQRLHGIISDLLDNQAYLKRRLEVMQDRERKMLSGLTCPPHPA